MPVFRQLAANRQFVTNFDRQIRGQLGEDIQSKEGVVLRPAEKGAFMFRVFVGFALCLGLAATASAQDAKAAQGEKLFTDQKCTLCHSVGEKGNKKGPLDGVASKLKADEIREWIVDAKGMTAKTKATRKPEMKAYTLPKDDVDALVAYLVTLKK